MRGFVFLRRVSSAVCRSTVRGVCFTLVGRMPVIGRIRRSLRKSCIALKQNKRPGTQRAG
jgi:hypothetical protein